MCKKISVIIPIYNADTFLPKCIESVINQTYKNLDIILINDCSTDNSGTICDAYARKDSRVTVINKNQNEGIGIARNTGLDIANGDYIAFVDNDDWLKLNMLETLEEVLNKSDADFAQCGHYLAYDKYVKYYRSTNKVVELMKYEAVEAYVNDKINVFVWNKLFKRELFNHVRFSKVGFGFDDFIIMKDILSITQKVVLIDSFKYFFYQRKGSTSKLMLSVEKSKCWIEIYKQQIEWMSKDYPELVGIMRVRYIGILLKIIYCLDNTNEINVAYIKKVDKEARKMLKKNKEDLSIIQRTIFKTGLYVYKISLIKKVIKAFATYTNLSMSNMNLLSLLNAKKMYYE